MRNVRAKYAGTCADSACGRPYEVGHTIRRAWVCTHLEHPAKPEQRPSPTVAEPEGQAVAEQLVEAQKQALTAPVVIVRPPEFLWGAPASRAAKAELKRCGVNCRTRMGRGTVAGKLDVIVAPWPGEPQPDPENKEERWGIARPIGYREWLEEDRKWQTFVHLVATTAVGGTFRHDSNPGADYQPLDDVAVRTDEDISQLFGLVRWNVEGIFVPSIDHGGTDGRVDCGWSEEDKPQWPIN